MTFVAQLVEIYVLSPTGDIGRTIQVIKDVADPDASTDRGFTLIETIVVLLMVGVLASVMVAVIAVIFRNVPGDRARADDSRSYQRLIQWLPRDAASTPPASSTFRSVGIDRAAPAHRVGTSST